jgi:hypothetical protein
MTAYATHRTRLGRVYAATVKVKWDSQLNSRTDLTETEHTHFIASLGPELGSRRGRRHLEVLSTASVSSRGREMDKVGVRRCATEPVARVADRFERLPRPS